MKTISSHLNGLRSLTPSLIMAPALTDSEDLRLKIT